ncbi:hypothetical protein N7535_008909 [Penicillium sp. DV-2018c]|nr:hypothetical protein N7461_002669 [Penicillium sp. DV-2018c]KAJ5561227.1 hypothetical protein N7535_009424 [Penicillium sp. DV-2018c]KAJ5563745.1 hypothetical protein N7535_008909 [Penicillium sp. DV-2018c]
MMTSSAATKLLQSKSFDWAEESEELGQQANDALFSDIIRPQAFDGAGESEELGELAKTTDEKKEKEAIVRFSAVLKLRLKSQSDLCEHIQLLGFIRPIESFGSEILAGEGILGLLSEFFSLFSPIKRLRLQELAGGGIKFPVTTPGSG